MKIQVQICGMSPRWWEDKALTTSWQDTDARNIKIKRVFIENNTFYVW